MSADADLNATQFQFHDRHGNPLDDPDGWLPTTEVGRLPSGDYPGETVEDSYQHQLSARTKGYGDWPIQQQELNLDIGQRGIHEPIARGPGPRLKNGHHRYYAARENKVASMPYYEVP